MLPLETCCGCTACAMSCPKQCIQMLPDQDGFIYPIIHTDSCIHCGKCERICPVLNAKTTPEVPLQAFAAKNTDLECRRNSSSGGVFSVLAEYVLGCGGIVFGAAMTETLRVEHRPVTSLGELASLRGSKYVSSDLGNSFAQVKTHLQTGHMVLFSGTPCQVEGLLHYLGKPYDNLLTVDLICHGVPSAKVWRVYISFLKNKHRSEIASVNFRSKDSGWKSFSMKVLFDSGQVYSAPMRTDPYLHAFLDNLCLRPSCHNCKFKFAPRHSDFTLADFWGIQKLSPKTDDDSGTSLVFANTEAANELLGILKEKLWIEKTDSDFAIVHNSAMVKSVEPHHFRQYFFRRLGKLRFDLLVKNCFSPSYTVRLHRQIIKLIYRRN